MKGEKNQLKSPASKDFPPQNRKTEENKRKKQEQINEQGEK